MCFFVYLGSDRKLATTQPMGSGEPDFFVENESDEHVRGLFGDDAQFVYRISADGGCACGFSVYEVMASDDS